MFRPAQYDALPGLTFPAPADTYPGKEAVQISCVTTPPAFNLPVELSKRITELSWTGDEFQVRTDDEVFRGQQVGRHIMRDEPCHDDHDTVHTSATGGTAEEPGWLALLSSGAAPAPRAYRCTEQEDRTEDGRAEENGSGQR